MLQVPEVDSALHLLVQGVRLMVVGIHIKDLYGESVAITGGTERVHLESVS